jgi:hypothetical protein
MTQRRRPAAPCRYEALGGEGWVDRAPDAGALRCDSDHVERGRGRRRIEKPGLVVVGGRGRQTGPVLVGDLGMNQPARVDRLEPRDRLARDAGVGCDRQLRAVGDLHRKQEGDFDARFVEQIVLAIAAFGQREAAVGERGCVTERCEPFVQVEQSPGRDAAVDDVFALIAGVVPAAGRVELVAATRPFDALLVDAGEAGGDVRRVAGGAGEVLALDEGGQDRHAAALLVEERHRRLRERRERAVRDREGMARRRADVETIA